MGRKWKWEGNGSERDIKHERKFKEGENGNKSKGRKKRKVFLYDERKVRKSSVAGDRGGGWESLNASE